MRSPPDSAQPTRSAKATTVRPSNFERDRRIGYLHCGMYHRPGSSVAGDEDMLEGVLELLRDGSTVFLQRYQDKLIGVELPINVDLKVVSTDPGFKGDTVSGATKPAKLETGATIQVPLFIQSGDVIRVDTRDQSYVERA